MIKKEIQQKQISIRKNDVVIGWLCCIIYELIFIINHGDIRRYHGNIPSIFAPINQRRYLRGASTD